MKMPSFRDVCHRDSPRQRLYLNARERRRTHRVRMASDLEFVTMTHIAYHKSRRRPSHRRGGLSRANPLVVYASVALGSMLLLGGVAVAAVI